MHNIYSSEAVPGSDTSDELEGSSNDCGSDHDEKVAESNDEEGDTTPTLVATEADNRMEIQDLEYDRE